MCELSRPAPEDADPRWREMNDILKRLLEILINHTKMRENARQQVSKAPASHCKVFTMWAYIGHILVSDAMPPYTRHTHTHRDSILLPSP